MLIPFARLFPAPGETKSTTGSRLVKEAAGLYMNYLNESFLYFRMRAGLKIEHLPGQSYEAAEARMKHIRAILPILNKINFDEISYEEQLTCRLLQWHVKETEEYHRYFWFQCPVAAYSSPIPDINRFFTGFHFKTKEDMARYLRLVEQYGTFIRELTVNVKEQYRRKFILPKPALEKMSIYLESLVQPPEKSFLYVKDSRLKVKGVTSARTAEFQKQLAKAITTKVEPALKEMVAFVKGDYRNQAPTRVGLWQYPGGKEYYRYLVGYYTSLDYTPEQVHRTGLQQVKALNSQLNEVRKKAGFKGDLEAFRRFLKTDPRFVPKSPEAVGERLMRFKKVAEAQLPRFFKRIPKAPCGVKRLDLRLEATQTYGFYEPPIGSEPKGYYFYNASHLDKKNILNAASASLILHELLPGHHFQIALQAENENLSGFRKESFLTPYNEGWGEYAAFLGIEMGVYKDPYDLCSLIMEDLFMALRLVVDTGMNYYGWPRQKAIDFMKKYALQPEVEIESETLRYSTGIPGQALGYKTGHMKIRELRKRAEKALGDHFDIKEFHDVILGSGTLPLSLLERHVDRYIHQKSILPQ
jgi:uncharacterized protein (DUF885 family)